MFRKASIILLATAFAVACVTGDPNKKTKEGAGIGAAAGAIVGAVIGNQSSNPRTGAVIGAAAGTAIGAAIGHRLDQQQKELQQIPGLEVTRPAENEIAVQMTNDILFDFNSTSLRSASEQTLANLATNFKQYPDETISVEGHTDAVGTTDYNHALSERRASSVRDYLMDRGISSSRITASGLGESDPKATNDTPEGRQINRRVEIHIHATQG